MKYIIGIDLGGTKIATALLNERLAILDKIKIETQAKEGTDHVLGRVAESVFQLIKSRKLKPSNILGIGMGSPGPLNSKKGIIFFAPNLGWKNVPLKKIMEKKTKLPVFMGNDANVAALGEERKGVGKGIKNLIFITLGTGIGAGLIINGELFLGKDETAAEIGHTVLFPDGVKCNCKNNGCFEMYASATGIVRRTKEAIEKGRKSILSSKLPTLTSKDVYDAAVKNDALAKEIMHETGRFLGIGLTSITNLLNLDMIILGGNVADAGEILFKPLREEVKKAFYPANTIKIVKAKLGTDAGIIGAACLVLDSHRK